MTVSQSAEAWQVPTRLLQDGGEGDLWIVGGSFTTHPPPAFERLPGAFALPGLVDAHAHLSLSADHGTLDLPAIDERLEAWGRQGVLAVRDVGAPQSVTLKLRDDPTRPTLFAAGRWLAPKDRFFPSLHDPVEAVDLQAAALAEVARGASWVKVIGDWSPEPNYDPALLRAVVDAVHAAGARVAVHSQWETVGPIVRAGVDSVEHGSLLDEETLRLMASRGVAWTPTLNAFNEPLPDDIPERVREQRARWLDNYRAMLPRASSLGVPLLAGTDTAGTIPQEVAHLIKFGVPPVAALAAASSRAREFLGLGSFDAGGPADVVTFAADPRNDPAVLAQPAAIVLRGRRIR
ncbi:MAG TPA: amidohydrolase family protein [Candidatus Limnocylindrales bacterium]|nr:amidohydrolase family protein [Candidatus Limnocylindrales bacterium]